jgi:hypothetical protein
MRFCVNGKVTEACGRLSSRNEMGRHFAKTWQFFISNLIAHILNILHLTPFYRCGIEDQVAARATRVLLSSIVNTVLMEMTMGMRAGRAERERQDRLGKKCQTGNPSLGFHSQPHGLYFMPDVSIRIRIHDETTSEINRTREEKLKPPETISRHEKLEESFRNAFGFVVGR